MYSEGNAYGQGNSFAAGEGRNTEPPIWRRIGPMPPAGRGTRP